MHTHKHKSANGSKWAGILSMACAVHCIATPVVAASLPIMGQVAHNEVLEIGLLVSCVIFSFYNLIGHYKFHKKNLPIIVTCLGLSISFILMLLQVSHFGELLAGVTLFTGWWLDKKELALNNSAECC
ncbi:MAG: MerC domain-containing protein [Bacteroidota bacterium]|nr:MerC domain-containing protein [Bacteroidota bacterium]